MRVVFAPGHLHQVGAFHRRSRPSRLQLLIVEDLYLPLDVVQCRAADEALRLKAEGACELIVRLLDVAQHPLGLPAAEVNLQEGRWPQKTRRARFKKWVVGAICHVDAVTAVTMPLRFRTLLLSDAGMEHFIASALTQNAIAPGASPSHKQHDASLSLRFTIKCEAVLGNTRCEPMMSPPLHNTQGV